MRFAPLLSDVMSKSVEEIIDFLKRSDDVDAMLQAFVELKRLVTKRDIPRLVAEIRNHECDFCTREWLAEPISEIAGAKALPDLLLAYQLNREDGHDNDSFTATLEDLVYADTEGCRRELTSIVESGDDSIKLIAKDFLLFCDQMEAHNKQDDRTR